MSMAHIAVSSRLRPPAAFNGYLWWDFTKRHSVPPGFTYTRNSVKYVWNPTLNQYVPLAANVYAPDYDPLTGACRGYRAEQAQTNLLLWSSDFSKASWSTNNSSKDNAESVVSGGVAKKLVSTVSYSSFWQPVGKFSGAPETLYMLIEEGNLPNVRIRSFTSGNSTVCECALEFSTGAVSLVAGSGSGYAIKLKNAGPNGGWLWLFYIIYSGTSGASRSVEIRNGGAVNTGFLYVHHAQLTADAIVGSPIVTDGSTYRRDGDMMTRTMLPKLGATCVNVYSCKMDYVGHAYNSLGTSFAASSVITGGTAVTITTSGSGGSTDRFNPAFSIQSAGVTSTLLLICKDINSTLLFVEANNNGGTAGRAQFDLSANTVSHNLSALSATAGIFDLVGGVKALYLTCTWSGSGGRFTSLYNNAYGSQPAGKSMTFHAVCVTNTAIPQWPVATLASSGTTYAEVPLLAGMPEAWYDQSQVTMLTEIEFQQAPSAAYPFMVSQAGASGNHVNCVFNAGVFASQTNVATVQQHYSQVTASGAGTYKAALSANANQTIVSSNGSSNSDAVSAKTMPLVGVLQFGFSGSAGSNQINGWQKKIALAPITQTSAQLNALTA